MAMNYTDISNCLKELIVQNLSKHRKANNLEVEDNILERVKQYRKSIAIFEGLQQQKKLDPEALNELLTLSKNLMLELQSKEILAMLAEIEKLIIANGGKIAMLNFARASAAHTHNPADKKLSLDVAGKPEISHNPEEEIDVKFHFDISEPESSKVVHPATQNTAAKQTEVTEASLNAIAGKEREIRGLIARESEHQIALQEKDFILQESALSDFYFVFQITFTDVLLACKTIHSGMIEETDRTWGDAAASIVERFGNKIPVAGIIADIFAGALRAASYREKQAAVNRGACFIADIATAGQIAEIMARRLTLSQMNEIRALAAVNHKGAKAKLHKVGKFVNKVFVNDIDTNIKQLSDKQCRRLLKGIMKGKVAPHPDVKHIDNLISIILKKPFVYRSPLDKTNTVHQETLPAIHASAATHSTHVPPLERSVSSNIRDMKTIIEEQQAQLKAQEQRQRDLEKRLQQQAEEALKQERMQREFDDLKKKMELLTNLSVSGNGNQAQALALPPSFAAGHTQDNAAVLFEYNQRMQNVENGLQILEESVANSKKPEKVEKKKNGKKDKKDKGDNKKPSLMRRIFRRNKKKNIAANVEVTDTPTTAVMSSNPVERVAANSRQPKG